MADYVSIGEFDLGWTFFAKKVFLYGDFPCSDFDCAGCDDWLDCENQNRKVKNTKASIFFDTS